VNKVNTITTHTYAFIKYIFLGEMKNNDDFELSTFINKPFFMEVFLSLVDRQIRDGVKSGSGMSTLKTVTRSYRDLIAKHKEQYIQYSAYVPQKLTHAQQSADYECTKIHTAYLNNIKARFGDRFRQVMNLICNKKKKSEEIQQKMKAARHADEAIKELIKNSVTIPCANVKRAVARKELPKDGFLKKNEKSLVESILTTYPSDYSFLQSSIYYDVKANPLQHMKAFFKLGQLLKTLTLDKQTGKHKSFVVFPLRTSFVPAYITVDTMIMNYHILGSKSFKEEKSAIWQKILNMKYRALKKQNALIFQGMILTDGVGATILKQNFDSGRRRKNDSDEYASGSSSGKRKAATKKDDAKEEFEYIEGLGKEKLKKIEGRCVLIDPGRRDILYCMDESSTVSDKRIFRFTKNQRSKKSRRLRYLRNQLKPDRVKTAELELSKVPSATIDIEQFVKYLEVRRVAGEKLCKYYSNETEKDQFPYYPDPMDFKIDGTNLYYGNRLLFITRVPDEGGPNSDDIPTYIRYLTLLLSVDHLRQRLTDKDVNSLNLLIKDVPTWLENEQPSDADLEKKKAEVKHEAHKIISKLLLLPFRKLKFASKIYYDKCDERLVKDLKSSFGESPVLIVGDWSAPNVRFQEPTRNKGLLRYLQKKGFQLFLIDEFKTSTCCPFCTTHKLEKFREVINPRPYQRTKQPRVTCHGLLRYVTVNTDSVK
jgi:hypothetical protein